MGMTPTGGLVMSSRSGDLDPGVVVFLNRARGVSGDALEELLNRKSGLLALAAGLSGYISKNLPAAFTERNALADYRTNPYVLMTSARVMDLDKPSTFGTFLFNSKLYMALETSFGKSIEAAFVGQYPLNSNDKWIEPPEKQAEFDALVGLGQEEKAQQRTSSVWREIDESCVVGSRRYMTSIKSGPNTISALEKLQFPRNSLPHWVRGDFTDTQLFWFATAMTTFYDEGI